MLTLLDYVNLVGPSVGANRDPVIEINKACERYLNKVDCVGSLELVAITVTTDANGQGFIILPARYRAIRGSVHTNIANSFCASPDRIRNEGYEYAPGNLGMLVGSDPMRGIIPIIPSQGDTVQLRTYKVPACITVGSLTYFTCLCKRAFQILQNDTDIPAVQSIGAIQFGIDALDAEYARDKVRAKDDWEDGLRLLVEQRDNDTGSEALGKIQVEDDFCLSGLGMEEGWGWGGYGYGGW